MNNGEVAIPDYDLDRTSLVMLGNWNQLLLSPRWMIKNIGALSDEKLPPVEVQLVGLIPRMKYSLSDVVITPGADALVVSPSNTSKESFRDVQQICSEIFQKLSHTPLNAIGHNFTLNLAPDQELKSDKVAIDDSIEDALNDELSKKLKKDECSSKVISSLNFDDTPFELNIYFEKHTPNNYKLQFNFNYNLERIDIVEVIETFTTNMEIAEEMFSKLVNTQ